MKQHAEPADRPQPALPGRFNQPRRQRNINNIGDHSGGAERREIQLKRRLPGHAERRRVDEQVGLRETAGQFAPGHGARPTAKVDRQRLGPLGGAIGHHDPFETARHQGADDCTRRATGPEDDRRPGRRPPFRRLDVETVEKAGDIGVVAAQRAVVAP